MTDPRDDLNAAEVSVSPATRQTYDHETTEGRIAAFHAWSARKKRELGFFAGLRFSRNNTGGWCFSRHWPHLLCWDWSIQVGPYRKGYDTRRFGLSIWPPVCKQVHIDLWLFKIHVLWQDYKTMSALGPHGADAPSIHPTTKQRRAQDEALIYGRKAGRE